ncbi:hypothetical protein TNCV_29601 [Trichonephila clavipes]|nr:hypothetical protein TNCV_29601 [Trichonephila clavipes]
MIIKFEEFRDLSVLLGRRRILSKKSLFLWFKEPPVPTILQQVVDQCHGSWRFRGRLREVDDAWPWKILWSDEAHFYLDGTVYSQNYCIWGTSPPDVLNQQPLHSDYVTT